MRHFVVFEDEGHGKLIKKMAGYHQFHAVNLPVEGKSRRLLDMQQSIEPPILWVIEVRDGQTCIDPKDRRLDALLHVEQPARFPRQPHSPHGTDGSPPSS